MNIRRCNNLIVIACSTGGPRVLKDIIPELSTNLNAAVLIVQHMPAGFTKSLANSLNICSKHRVKEAEDGEVMEKGVIYVAPSGFQTTCCCEGDKKYFSVTAHESHVGLAPCADVTISSLADSSFEKLLICVLTGMGKDATEGVRTLKKKRKAYVINQDEASCTVYGMPKSISDAKLSDMEVGLSDIPKVISNYMEV